MLYPSFLGKAEGKCCVEGQKMAQRGLLHERTNAGRGGKETRKQPSRCPHPGVGEDESGKAPSGAGAKGESMRHRLQRRRIMERSLLTFKSSLRRVVRPDDRLGKLRNEWQVKSLSITHSPNIM